MAKTWDSLGISGTTVDQSFTWSNVQILARVRELMVELSEVPDLDLERFIQPSRNFAGEMLDALAYSTAHFYTLYGQKAEGSGPITSLLGNRVLKKKKAGTLELEYESDAAPTELTTQDVDVSFWSRTTYGIMAYGIINREPQVGVYVI